MLKSLGSFGLKIALRYHCFVTGLREGEVKLVFYINLLRESLNIDINSISLCTLITSIMSLKAGKPAKSVVLADTVHCTVGPSRYVKFLSKPENQRSLSSQQILYTSVQQGQSICKISLKVGKPVTGVALQTVQCTVGAVDLRIQRYSKTIVMF